MSLSSIPHIIPVLSGKGGVGKSSVTVQLALALSLRGHSVGVLDIDLTGPSIPRLFGIESSKVKQAPGGWLPVQVHPATNLSSSSSTAQTNGSPATPRIGTLHCMSLGFLLRDRGDAVVWRGPKKTAMVKQLLSDVLWPPGTEYLLIDTPPGTSDEHISLITNLLDPAKVSPGQQRLGAVVVTTPQAISTADVRKELTFCVKTSLKVLGVVENMAGYVCPCCGEVTNVFSKGGGEVMAREWGVPFLGSVPLDGEGWGALVEEGKRPSRGTTVPAGEAVRDANGANGHPDVSAAGSGGPGEEDGHETLVEKYTSCSLHPIFSGFAQQLAKFEAAIPHKDDET